VISANCHRLIRANLPIAHNVVMINHYNIVGGGVYGFLVEFSVRISGMNIATRNCQNPVKLQQRQALDPRGRL
jgi:hypothetical protein